VLSGCKSDEDKVPTTNQIDEGLKGLPPGDQDKVANMGGGSGATAKAPVGAAPNPKGANKGAPPSGAPNEGGAPTK